MSRKRLYSDDVLAGGRWVTHGLVTRWVPSPLPNAREVVEAEIARRARTGLGQAA